MDKEFWGEPVSIYTRARALEDGVLVDLTEQGKQYGFKLPLACTEAVWRLVAWSDDIEARKADATGQSTDGRLHDVLSLARWRAQRAAQEEASAMSFDVLMVPVDGPRVRPVLVSMWMTIGGGDDGEPVLTLMLEGED